MPALPLKTWFPLSAALALMAVGRGFSTPVATPEALVEAVRDGAEGAVIEIAPGTYELAEALAPKTGMTL